MGIGIFKKLAGKLKKKFDGIDASSKIF